MTRGQKQAGNTQRIKRTVMIFFFSLVNTLLPKMLSYDMPVFPPLAQENSTTSSCQREDEQPVLPLQEHHEQHSAGLAADSRSPTSHR